MTIRTGGKRVSIARARQLARMLGLVIWWRPEPHLPESEQYALIFYGAEDLLV